MFLFPLRPSSRRVCTLMLALALLVYGNVSGADPVDGPQSLTLLGRSKIQDKPAVTLTAAERSRLRVTPTLRVGVAAPDSPPSDIINNGHYEGLTADYIALLAQLLGVTVEARLYADHNKLLDALREGEVDLVGTANVYEAQQGGITLTNPYSGNQPVLVTRYDSENMPAQLTGLRLAVQRHYLPRDVIAAAYPEAQIQDYASSLAAISAVAFGTADVFLGDASTASYLIGLNAFNDIHLTNFSAIDSGQLAFAVRDTDKTLLSSINKALTFIPSSARFDIERRWGVYDASMTDRPRLSLNERERAWVERHPVVKVAAVARFRPLAFFDDGGTFRGLSADVLAKVTQYTGLQFETVPSASLAEATASVLSGDAQLIAALTPSAERDQVLHFSQPYFNTAFVLVSRQAPDSPATLEALDGKTLVMIRGVSLSAEIARDFPNIRQMFVDNAAEVMQAVARGDASAGVSTLPAARFAIMRQYVRGLRIAGVVGSEPARFSFATAKQNGTLQSILEKTLLSISPEEMNEIRSRWRNDGFIDENYWQRNQRTLINGFLIAGALLLLATAWIIYLRRQIQRRTLAERALSDQLEFMRVLIDGTPHPIYIRDLQGRMVECNSGYLDAFEASREDVIGKRIIDQPFVAPGEGEGFHAEYLQVMAEGKPRIRDRELNLRNGERLTIYHWMLPYRSSDGSVLGMISGWIDISERQRLMAMVQNANRAKSTFLATMSHEIRTPLNAVTGMLEIALKRANEGQLDREAVQVASEAAQGLLELIGDILDISRIEAAKLTLAPERANLLCLANAVIRIFAGLAEQKQLRLATDFHCDLDRDVMVDPTRFKQIVSNLLSNAIKFTQHGEVRFSMQLEALPDAQSVSVRISVEDQGTGISLEDQRELFRPFSQASDNTLSARAGSGLGLFICRTLCEMMDGSITLSSEPGVGTRVDVSLQLPLATMDQALPHMSDSPSARGNALNVLVVDDYSPNRLLLTKQLTYLGHRFAEAADGLEALAVLNEATYDVVLTDCNMPKMDGYALALSIREREAQNGLARCLIIGCTANAQAEERERCLAAGMDDCLFKPFTLEALNRQLQGHMPYVPMSESPAQADEDALDVDHLLTLVRGDTEALRMLLTDVANTAREDQQSLLNCLTSLDSTSAARLAHRLKGGALMIKAYPLMAACEDVEQACLAADAGAIEQALREVAVQLENLMAAVETHLI